MNRRLHCIALLLVVLAAHSALASPEKPVVTVDQCALGAVISQPQSSYSPQGWRERYLEIVAICGTKLPLSSREFKVRWLASVQQCRQGRVPEVAIAASKEGLVAMSDFGMPRCPEVLDIAVKYGLVTGDEARAAMAEGKQAQALRVQASNDTLQRLRAEAASGSGEARLILAMRLYDIEFQDPGDHWPRQKEAMPMLLKLAGEGHADRIFAYFNATEKKLPWYGPGADGSRHGAYRYFYEQYSRIGHAPSSLKMAQYAVWVVSQAPTIVTSKSSIFMEMTGAWRVARSQGTPDIQKALDALEPHYARLVAGVEAQDQREIQRNREAMLAFLSMMGRSIDAIDKGLGRYNALISPEQRAKDQWREQCKREQSMIQIFGTEEDRRVMNHFACL